jgi:WD40 repeat protein
MQVIVKILSSKFPFDEDRRGANDFPPRKPAMPTRLIWKLIPLAFIGFSAMADEPVSFVAKIAPLLKTQCLGCHDAELAEADYRLDTYQHLMKRGDGTAAVIAEQPDGSKLYQVLVHEDEDLRMPAQSDPLPEASIDLIRQWIEQGAAFDGRAEDQPLTELLPEINHPLAPEKYPAPIPLSALAFHPDQKELLVGGYHEITQWNLNGELTRRISNQGERTYSIDLHPTTSYMVSASGTPGVIGEVRVFDLSTGKAATVLIKTDEVIMDARYSPDGKTIAVAMPDGSTRLLDSETGKEKAELLGHSDQVLAVTWHPDGQRIATASRDHTAKIFDCQSGSSVATFTGHTRSVNDVAFLNGDEAVSVSDDGKAQLWNTRNGKRIREIANNRTPLLSVAVSPNKFSISGALATQWFKKNGNQPTERFTDTDAWTTTTVFDAIGNTFVSGTQTGEVIVREDEKEPTRFEAIPGR